MTGVPTDLAAVPDGNVETPSGKWRSAENFPVGSFLIRRDLRPHVHAFYRFARNADDIADNPELSGDEKIRRLDRMAAILDGASGQDTPAAAAMKPQKLGAIVMPMCRMAPPIIFHLPRPPASIGQPCT